MASALLLWIAWLASDRARREAAGLDAARAEAERRAEAEAARAEAEAARANAEAMLREGQRLGAIGELATGVAHDFGNLLAAVVASLRLIEDQTTDRSVIELAGHGLNAAERAQRLVRQLTTFARRAPRNPAPLDLAQVVTKARPLIEYAAGSRV
ncbi:MAG TPA: hypothetical protein VD970_06385, partial [Acetobacteraceae bacterium]|nr:hypothetical protein [Acetobacteraceae bacterium]